MVCKTILLYTALFPHAPQIQDISFFVSEVEASLNRGEYIEIANVPPSRMGAIKMVINTFPRVIARILPNGNIQVTKVQ